MALGRTYAQNYCWQFPGGITGGVGYPQTVNAICINQLAFNIYAAGETILNPYDTSTYLNIEVYDIYSGLWTEMNVGPAFNPQQFYGVEINAMCTDYYNNLYVAGSFSDGNYVTQWDGLQWDSVGAGATALNANGPITSLATNGTDLFATGSFTNAQGLYYVAIWNGTAWAQAGTLTSNSPMSVTGNVIAVDGGDLYSWNGSSWQNISSPAPLGLVNASTWGILGVNYPLIYSGSSDGQLWDSMPMPAGPYMVTALSQDANYIYAAVADNNGRPVIFARSYSDTAWHQLGSGACALNLDNNSNITAMVPYNNGLLAAGYGSVYTSYLTGCNVFYYGPLLPSGLYASLAVTNPNCGTPGTIKAIARGGTPPYHYLWGNTFNQGNVLTGVNSGYYWVTVQDANGNLAYASAQVDSSCQAYITAFTYSDMNANCHYDSGDVVLNDVILTATSLTNHFVYSNTDINGNLALAITDTGYYVLNFTAPSACAQRENCGDIPDTIHITNLHDTIALGNIAYTGGVDLKVLINTYEANPGFTKSYKIIPYNYQASASPATVVFTYDTNLIYQSCYPPAVVNTSARTITWSVPADSVAKTYGQIYADALHCSFQVPSTLSLSYLLQSNFTILPYTGDCDTANNSINLSEPCTGSHDPNFKSVSPSGPTPSTDSVLTYTIYFQNTGTDSTHFVTVTDTLSPYLRPATVRNIVSSTAYTSFNISGQGILTWVFNPLRLPPDSIDSVGSSGYITFSVKRAYQVPYDTPITNTASVYFDYNNPIQTNQATNTFVCRQIPPTVNINICRGDSFNFTGRWLYTSGFYTDTVVTASQCDSIVSINLSVLPPVNSTITDTICTGDTLHLGGYSYTTAGIYTDTLSTGTGCDSIITLNLTVMALPVVTLSWDSLYTDGVLNPSIFQQDTEAIWCEPLGGLFSAVPISLKGGSPYGGNYTGYLIHNGIMYVDSLPQYRRYSETVSYTFVGANNCAATAVDSIIFDICEGLHEVTVSPVISIYPNPSTAQLIITTQNFTPQSITVYDDEGRLINTLPFKSEIDMTALSSGVYFIEVKGAEGVVRKRVVKM